MAKHMTIDNDLFFGVLVKILKEGKVVSRKEVARRIVEAAFPRKENEGSTVYELRITPPIGTQYTRLNEVIGNLEDGTCDAIGMMDTGPLKEGETMESRSKKIQAKVYSLVERYIPDARGRKPKAANPTRMGELFADLINLDSDD